MGTPVPSTRLGLLEVEGVTASVVPIELPATNQESWDSVGLAVAGQSLILLSQDSEMVSTLHITELSDGNEPIEWRREVLGDIPSLSPSNDRRIPLSVVGTMVVAHDMTSLYWFDIDNETSMVQSLDPNEGCALGSSSESIVTPDGLVAIGGNCTRVKGGGQEEQLFGSYVFSLAADS